MKFLAVDSQTLPRGNVVGGAADGKGVSLVVSLLPDEFLLPGVMECCPATFPVPPKALGKGEGIPVDAAKPIPAFGILGPPP